MIGFDFSGYLRGSGWRHELKRRGLKKLLAIVIGIAAQSSAMPVKAQDSALIDNVKAAVVLNIARFVTWPADSQLYQSDKMQLCLYRANPLHDAAAGIAGEEVGGRTIEIRQIESLAASDSCSVLLIAASEVPGFIAELPPDFNRPLLTVVDLTEAGQPMHSRSGILISLVRNGARIGFDINLEKSRQAGLRMSSELLKLANIVGGND